MAEASGETAVWEEFVGLDPTDAAKLADPFPPERLSWRIVGAGIQGDGTPWVRTVPYIDARDVMERLDEICGPGGWQTRVEQVDGLVLVGIGILVAGEWVWKWDGTGRMETGDNFSPAAAGKGDLSIALKRAAVAWGIGRYLHAVPLTWAQETYGDPDKGLLLAYTKEKGSDDKRYFSWDPPLESLEEWARPGGSGRPPAGTVNRETGEIPGEGASAEDVQTLLARANELEVEMIPAAEQKVKDAISSKNGEHLLRSKAWLQEKISEAEAQAAENGDLPF